METLQQKIHEFIVSRSADGTANMNRGGGLPDSAWQRIRQTGTCLWLDSGDIEAARDLWDPNFEALTTNNTLLNKEIQKGHYDELISEAADFLKKQEGEISPADLLLEINFILNALHGLRLARIFGAHVSVELHTDLANETERSVEYGRRFYAICPDQFYIKVPFTPAGLIAACRLGEQNIPVNLTLGFSVRQNVLAAQVARPAFVNVFLGRLNAFVEQSGLGTGENAGEKTTRATQRAIGALRRTGRTDSRLIAASMRSGAQVSSLAGVDVMTLPPAAVKEFAENPGPEPASCIEQDLTVPMQSGFTTADFNGDSLWEVSEPVHTAILELTDRPLNRLSSDELVDHFARAGCSDFLPAWTVDEVDTVMRDGKIPDFKVWGSRLKSHELGLDALMNISALCAFVTDQKALDDRIRSLI